MYNLHLYDNVRYLCRREEDHEDSSTLVISQSLLSPGQDRTRQDLPWDPREVFLPKRTRMKLKQVWRIDEDLRCPYLETDPRL